MSQKAMPNDQIKEFLEKNPVLTIVGMAVLGVLILQKPSSGPAWLKDLPPLGGRRNGAWRGKGSFGKGFGPVKVRHK